MSAPEGPLRDRVSTHLGDPFRQEVPFREVQGENEGRGIQRNSRQRIPRQEKFIAANSDIVKVTRPLKNLNK